MNLLLKLIAVIAVLEVNLQNGCSAVDKPGWQPVVEVPKTDVGNIKFSQTSVGGSTSDQIRISDLSSSMGQNGFNRDKSLQLVRMPGGSLTSLDNRRLAAAQVAQVPIFATIRDSQSPLPSYDRRFGSSKTYGEAVVYRARQGSKGLIPITKQDSFTGFDHRDVRIRTSPSKDMTPFVNHGFQVDREPRVDEPYSPHGNYGPKSSQTNSQVLNPVSQLSHSRPPSPGISNFPSLGSFRPGTGTSGYGLKPSQTRIPLPTQSKLPSPSLQQSNPWGLPKPKPLSPVNSKPTIPLPQSFQSLGSGASRPLSPTGSLLKPLPPTSGNSRPPSPGISKLTSNFESNFPSLGSSRTGTSGKRKSIGKSGGGRGRS